MRAQFAQIPEQSAAPRRCMTMKPLPPRSPFFASAFLLMAVLAVAGCAATGSQSPSARPVLYPNATLNRVGDAGARSEVDACTARARSAGLSPVEGNNAVGQRAGQGAAIGGVAAAVGALVTGRNLDSVLTSGVAGAAVGGSAGAVSGAMQNRPSNLYRQYVQRCLSDKGFDVIGWN
jgi:outer membrane lipoprotein SlyB